MILGALASWVQTVHSNDAESVSIVIKAVVAKHTRRSQHREYRLYLEDRFVGVADQAISEHPTSPRHN